jgi:hypothetical protein
MRTITTELRLVEQTPPQAVISSLEVRCHFLLGLIPVPRARKGSTTTAPARNRLLGQRQLRQAAEFAFGVFAQVLHSRGYTNSAIRPSPDTAPPVVGLLEELLRPESSVPLHSAALTSPKIWTLIGPRDD